MLVNSSNPISIWYLWKFIINDYGDLLIWAVLWFKLFRDQPEDSIYVSQEELKHIKSELNFASGEGHTLSQQKTTWRFMLFHPALLVNNYAFFVFGYLLFFAITWLPGYLSQTYGINIKEVGWFLMLPWFVATILLIIGGILSDKLWKKTHSLRVARSHVIWICQALSAICFIPVLLEPSLTVAIISISLGVGFGMMPNAAFYALNADLARDRAATSLGIMDAAFAFAGILAPLLTGILSGITGNFVAAFSLLIFLSVTSVIMVILFQHPKVS